MLNNEATHNTVKWSLSLAAGLLTVAWIAVLEQARLERAAPDGAAVAKSAATICAVGEISVAERATPSANGAC